MSAADHSRGFVGRDAELAELQRVVSDSASSAVLPVVHGVGGVGKTALVTQFAAANRREYPAGVWQVNAAGYSDVWELLAQLAADPTFGFAAGAAAGGSAMRLGHLIRDELKRRVSPTNGALLIIDDVDRPGLSRPKELGWVLDYAPGLHFVATTRLDPQNLASERLRFVSLAPLAKDAGLELLRSYHPTTASAHAADDEQAAAERIVDLLGGLPWALEQVAIRLGEGMPATAVEQYLTEHGVAAPAEAGAASHDNQVGVTLELALAALPAQAVTALHVASLLPNDAVPWSWLAAVTAKLHPDQPFDWDQLQAALRANRLLIGDPEASPVARLPRLVADQLAGHVTEQQRAELTAHILERVAAADYEHDLLAWEVRTILAYAHRATEETPEIAAQIMQASHGFYPSVHRQLADPRVLTLAEAAFEQIEERHEQQPADLAIQRELALAHQIMAGVLRGQDPAAEFMHTEHAIGLHQYLLTQQPENRAHRRELAIALNSKAEFTEPYDATVALGLYQEALELIRGLQQQEPNDASCRRDLIVAMQQVASLTSDPAAVLDLYQQVLTLARESHQQQPDNLLYQHDLVASLHQVADRTQDPATALSLYQEALGLAHGLHQRLPADLLHERHFGLSLARVSDLTRDQDPATALQLAWEATDIYRDLHNKQPDSQSAKRELCISLEQLAEIMPDPAEALACYQESLAIRRDLQRQNPADPTSQRNLSLTIDRVAGLTADQQLALGLYQEAVVLRRELLQQNPDDLIAQRDLSIALARMVPLSSDQQAALAAAQESLAIRRELYRQQPGDPLAQSDLSFALDQVADLTPGPAAEQLRQESLALLRDFFQRYPDQLSTQQELAAVFRQQADAAKEQDPEAALELYRDALTIRRLLHRLQPEDQQVQRDLAVALMSLADLSRDDDPATAAKLYQENLVLARQLYQQQPDSSLAQRHLNSSFQWAAALVKEQDPAAGLAIFEEAVAFRRHLCQQQPTNLDFQRDLMLGLLQCSFLYQTPEQRLAACRETVTVAQGIARVGRDQQSREYLHMALKGAAETVATDDPQQAKEWEAMAAELADE